MWGREEEGKKTDRDIPLRPHEWWVFLGMPRLPESSAACLSFFDLNREPGRQLSLSNACIAPNQPSESTGDPKELGVMVCT